MQYFIRRVFTETCIQCWLKNIIVNILSLDLTIFFHKWRTRIWKLCKDFVWVINNITPWVIRYWIKTNHRIINLLLVKPLFVLTDRQTFITQTGGTLENLNYVYICQHNGPIWNAIQKEIQLSQVWSPKVVTSYSTCCIADKQQFLLRFSQIFKLCFKNRVKQGLNFSDFVEQKGYYSTD